MIIAISSDKADINSEISNNFARCRCFCIYNTETFETIFLENPASLNKQNAGIEVVDFLQEHNIDSVLAYRFGSIVTAYLRKNDIQIIISLSSKTINEIINQLKSK